MAVQEDTRVRIETVPLEVRYLGAWSEINSRIGQRQNALSIFVVISAAVFALVLGQLKIKEGTSEIQITEVFATLILPVSGAIFSWLNSKHDETIALLRVYLNYCESARSLPDPQVPAIIGYNNHPEYAAPARQFRRLHDYAFAAAIAIICLPSLWITMYHAHRAAWHVQHAFVLYGVYVPVYVGSLLWAMALALKGPRYERTAEVARLLGLRV